MDGADVGVVQGRERLGLVHEALPGFFVPGQLWVEKLECNGAAKLRVLGSVQDTHSSTTQFFQDSEVRYCRTDHKIPRSSKKGE